MADEVLETKLCTTCMEEKELKYFAAKKHLSDGYFPMCKPCYTEETQRLFLQGERMCSTCLQTKSLDQFSKQLKSTNGLKYTCKHCHDIWYKNHYAKNGRKRNEEYIRSYRPTEAQMEQQKKAKQQRDEEYNRIHADGVREKKHAQMLKTKRRKLISKIDHRLRSRTRQAIVKSGATVILPHRELIGCSKEKLVQYLENQFIEGMCWEIYGRSRKGIRGFEIDHIKPCHTFDLTDPEQQKECFNYTNCRPLWSDINRALYWDLKLNRTS